MWFSGDIATAISTVQKESKVLLVFGYGDNDASKAVLKLFEKASEILSNKLSQKCICLKFEENTQSFIQFSEYWPILTTPTIHFISGAGQKICEPLLEEVTEKDILQRIFNADNQLAQPMSNDQPSTSSTSSKMENTAVETEAEKQAKLALKTEEYRKKISEARQKKEDDFKREEKRKEMQRREEGQKIAEQKREREERELKKRAEERRKDKAADAEHLKKLREQIAQDRANRAKQFETKSKEEKEKEAAEIREIKEKKLKEERERLEEQRRIKDTQARIQFRFSDGSTNTNIFSAEQNLSDARSYLLEKDLVHGDFIFGTTMPKRRFTSEDENQDFRSLGLTPASVLTVIPQSSSSVSNNGGLLGTIIGIPYFIVNLLIKLLGSIFPGGNTPPAETPSQNQRKPEHSRDANVRRRRLGDFSDDEQATYNGNSTQQL